MNILDKKNILITGCNRGIGLSTMRLCASFGANIWAHARTYNEDFEHSCSSIGKEFHVDIVPVYFDLADKEKMLEAVKLIRASKAPINGLISNAGITHNSFFQMTHEVLLANDLYLQYLTL